MDTLFSPDSTLMRALTRIADTMILNLLFIVTSLPVFTLGASLTALNFTAMRIATGNCNSVSGDYFRSFRRNFAQATVIGLILALCTAVLAAWYVVVTNLTIGPLAGLLLLAVWYVLAFTLATTALFAFPYLATFEASTRQVLRTARLMSWRHPLTAIAGLLLIGLAVAVTAFAPHFTGYGLAWLLIGFAGIAVCNGLLFARVFDRYIAAAAASNQT